jgi:adenine-specific DNA methylase
LGVAGLQSIVEEAKTVEGLHEVGNYAESAAAAGKLLDIVDRLDSGALNKVSLENVRTSAAELGKVISNLPLGFDNQAKKLKFSDLPPALSNLMDDMIERVEKKIGKEDADIATAELRAFKSGSEVYSQAEISSQMSKLLRLLT